MSNAYWAFMRRVQKISPYEIDSSSTLDLCLPYIDIPSKAVDKLLQLQYLSLLRSMIVGLTA